MASEEDRYTNICLGIREIVQSDFDKKIAYKTNRKSARDGRVQDGVNVHEYIG